MSQVLSVEHRRSGATFRKEQAVHTASVHRSATEPPGHAVKVGVASPPASDDHVIYHRTGGGHYSQTHGHAGAAMQPLRSRTRSTRDEASEAPGDDSTPATPPPRSSAASSRARTSA